MYQGFYKLKENPFRLTPDPGFMCMTEQHQEALSGLIYSVCTRPGLTVLVGEAGTGKTTLLYSLLKLLDKRQYITVLCTNPMLSRDEFYDFLVMKLGIDCPSGLKSRRLEALEQHLRATRAQGRPTVLIVDEAQRLSPELLEEIRLLLNLETAQEKLLEIIMSGQPELDDILRRPELRQFKQRVSCVCRLRPLSLPELNEYVNHRLAQAGLPGQTLFPAAILESVLTYTQGIPRLINSLCDNALQIGFAVHSPVITEAVLQEAASDLDLVPHKLEIAVNGHATAVAVGAENVTPVPPPVVRNGKPTLMPAPAPVAAPPAAPAAAHVPLEGYSTRQKSLGLFSSFLDYWR